MYGAQQPGYAMHRVRVHTASVLTSWQFLGMPTSLQCATPCHAYITERSQTVKRRVCAAVHVQILHIKDASFVDLVILHARHACRFWRLNMQRPHISQWPGIPRRTDPTF
jgi:hypothetical protein